MPDAPPPTPRPMPAASAVETAAISAAAITNTFFMRSTLFLLIGCRRNSAAVPDRENQKGDDVFKLGRSRGTCSLVSIRTHRNSTWDTADSTRPRVGTGKRQNPSRTQRMPTDVRSGSYFGSGAISGSGIYSINSSAHTSYESARPARSEIYRAPEDTLNLRHHRKPMSGH